MNLFKIFKKLDGKGKQELIGFIKEIKKETPIEFTISIPKSNINWKKLSQTKFQLFDR